ncbi:V-type ATP synthase subunit E [Candidatus Anstonella stagnisolia]|nr:V-type ATP synthase subunit E [Candidatus Anstonella stagnisolia]
MGFDALSHEIEKKASDEAKRVLHEADNAAEKIISDAQAASKQKVSQAKGEVSSYLETEKAERLTSAKLACSKIIADSKEQAMLNSLELVWEEMLKERNSPSYKKLLHTLAQSAVEELGTTNVLLFTNSADRKHFAGSKYKLGEPITCAGGVVAEKKDGSVRVDKTFESIFEEKKDDLRKRIFAMLF